MQIRYLTLNFTNLFVLLVETFLGLRFTLKLFGANASNGFVSWLYDMSAVLLEPFRGIFPNKVFENTFVFEFSTLFAMMIYAIIGMLLIALVEAVVPVVAPKKKK